jgi:hypothetical protein
MIQDEVKRTVNQGLLIRSMAQEQISVTVLVGPEIMSHLSASEWRALTDQMDRPPYFILHEMANGYLKHLRTAELGESSTDEALALQLKRSGVVVGILLLERGVVNVSGVHLPALALVVHPHAPHADMLLACGESLAAFWSAITTALSNHNIRWEVLRFPSSRDNSVSKRESAVDEMRPRVLARHVGHADYFACTEGYESLEAKFRPSLRRRLGQAKRQLSRMGVIGYTCVPGGLAGSDDAFEKFLTLEGAGWKGSHGTAIQQSAGLRAHYADLYALDTPNCKRGLTTLWPLISAESNIGVHQSLSAHLCRNRLCPRSRRDAVMTDPSSAS